MSEASDRMTQARMSRGVRVSRGLAGSTISTLLAAASHAAAGGEITALAIVATILVSLPLCVALAGRTGSIWRLAVAVSVSQFLFHWSFAALGTAVSAPVSGGIAPAPHAQHLAQAQLLLNGPVPAASADALMWAAHAIAAALTVLLIARGEHAARSLAALICRVVSLPRAMTFTGLRAPAVAPVLAPQRIPLTAVWVRSTRSLRGPPVAV